MEHRAVVLRKHLPANSTTDLSSCIETLVAPKALKDDDVEVRVRAVAVNFADHLVLQGRYQIKTPLPFTPGYDWSGVVTRVGKAVTHVAPGDRVFGGTISATAHASGRGSGPGRGGMSELAVVPADFVRPFPPRVSFAQASMLGTTYGTAHYALKYEARLQRGEVCLVHAAAGALGLAACQVAKAIGALVIATASSDAKLAIARERGGADICINYRRESDWVGVVKAALGGHNGGASASAHGRLVDVVFDPVGMPTQCTKLMGYHSRLLVLGFTGWNAQAPEADQGCMGPAGETGSTLPTLALNRLLVKHCSVIGIYLFAFADREPDTVSCMWLEINDALESGAYDPVVFDCELRGLEKIGQALELTTDRTSYGKVVVLLNDDNDSAVNVGAGAHVLQSKL